MSLWPCCKGLQLFLWMVLSCFLVTCDFWPVLHERDNSVLWQRRDKLWLSLGCERPNPAPLHPAQSVLSASVTSFPTFPDHCGGCQTPHWSAGMISVWTIAPYAIKHCSDLIKVSDFTWTGFIPSKIFRAPWRQEVRPLLLDRWGSWPLGPVWFRVLVLISEVIWASHVKLCFSVYFCKMGNNSTHFSGVMRIHWYPQIAHSSPWHVAH